MPGPTGVYLYCDLGICVLCIIRCVLFVLWSGDLCIMYNTYYYCIKINYVFCIGVPWSCGTNPARTPRPIQERLAWLHRAHRARCNHPASRSAALARRALGARRRIVDVLDVVETVFKNMTLLKNVSWRCNFIP